MSDWIENGLKWDSGPCPFDSLSLEVKGLLLPAGSTL